MIRTQLKNLRRGSVLILVATTLAACMPDGEMIHLTFAGSVLRADVAAHLVSSGFVELDAEVPSNAAVVNQKEWESPRATRIFRHAADSQVGCFFNSRPEQGRWKLTCVDDERFELRQKARLPLNPGAQGSAALNGRSDPEAIRQWSCARH